MGRPLKIKQSTTVDIGFNPFSLLDQPTVTIPSGMSSSEYLGVVGGGYPSGIATATYPTVACTAYITGSGAEDNAYIITQKGATKYLVAAQTQNAESTIVAGTSYIIGDLGTTTNWTALGAGVNPQVGDVFTAITAGGAGDGLVSFVGICILANEAAASVTEGNMQISFDYGSGATQVSRLTNKYVWDYSTPPTRYAADFFVGSTPATTAKSGADITTWTNGTGELDLGQVSDYTS